MSFEDGFSGADLLCSKCRLPVVNARQTLDCGCRLCEECYYTLSDRLAIITVADGLYTGINSLYIIFCSGEKRFTCGKCGNAFNIREASACNGYNLL